MCFFLFFYIAFYTHIYLQTYIRTYNKYTYLLAHSTFTTHTIHTLLSLSISLILFVCIPYTHTMYARCQCTFFLFSSFFPYAWCSSRCTGISLHLYGQSPDKCVLQLIEMNNFCLTIPQINFSVIIAK